MNSVCLLCRLPLASKWNRIGADSITRKIDERRRKQKNEHTRTHTQRQRECCYVYDIVVSCAYVDSISVYRCCGRTRFTYVLVFVFGRNKSCLFATASERCTHVNP